MLRLGWLPAEIGNRVNEFHYIGYAQEVIFGVRSTALLSEAVDRFRWQRLMLCTTASPRSAGHFARIEAALGPRLVAIYEPVRPHVPDFQVDEAVALAAGSQVDAVIGLGGGSAIGMAKAVSLALEEKRAGQPASPPAPTDQPLVPVVAIPTTYAGSEMTPVYGVTHHAGGSSRKITVSNAKVAPRLILYDPLLTLDLPPDMTAATGINALAHCIEALYSISRNPLCTAAALSAVRHIVHALPRCYATAEDLEARTEMLAGSYLAATALANVAMGLHHGLCHVLGGTAGLPHGIANSIILPHAMRFNGDVASRELAQVAEAMGVAPDGRTEGADAEAAAQRVYDLAGQMNLPQHLRDVGVGEADLPRLAQLALQSRAVQNNPRPIRDASEVESVLRAAW